MSESAGSVGSLLYLCKAHRTSNFTASEVVMHVAEIPNVQEKNITHANAIHVEAGTNGHQGGDGGHGGRTHFSITDRGGTAIEVNVLDDGTGVAIELAGDSELDTFTEALEFGYKTLRKDSVFNIQLPPKVAAQIEVVERDLQELASNRWHQRESKSGAEDLREAVNRVVLSSKHLESLVKAHTFPTGR